MTEKRLPWAPPRLVTCGLALGLALGLAAADSPGMMHFAKWHWAAPSVTTDRSLEPSLPKPKARRKQRTSP
ncbi:hypothetical protein BD289DRAFT_448901 [Coniella lustricola]|uniref:Uncharacterized protein n=1 Tax=Coniella lustricola TaxID=2025994 RepID=A0A2T2ZRR6_9PEZI|nr:hypothetical protein BD289DRAFT_448901 [Coniella lustricola]